MTGSRPSHPRHLEVAITAPTIDALSAIRYVHAQALRRAAGDWASDEEIAAYVAHVYSPGYATGIEAAIQSQQLFGAHIDGRLVGTSGWSSFDDDTSVARVRWCHVEPIFAGMGLGAALLSHAESAAEAAGHTGLVARSTPNAAAFFERFGYGITAHGTRNIGPKLSVPVTFLRKHLQAPLMPAPF